MFICFLGHLPLVAQALENPGENLKEVGLSTELGTELPLSAVFKDRNGERKPLKDYLLPGKPNIIVPAYFDCPRLCGLLLNGVKDLLEELSLSLNEDYRVITVSFDPSDTPEGASKQFDTFASGIKLKSGSSSGWVFLTGDQSNIDSLMGSLGFLYREDMGEYAHTAAIFVLTPLGVVSQYFTNIQFSTRDVRLALVEAGKGVVGGIVDQVLLYCFRFDPTKGKYTWAAFNFVRVGALLTLLLLVGLFFWLRRKPL